jgi:hypothetical protein
MFTFISSQTVEHLTYIAKKKLLFRTLFVVRDYWNHHVSDISYISFLRWRGYERIPIVLGSEVGLLSNELPNRSNFNKLGRWTEMNDVLRHCQLRWK